MSVDISRAAVVTGGASGIGDAVVSRLLRDGHRVAILDLDEDRCATAARRHAVDGDVIGVACDVGNWTQVQAAVDTVVRTFGGVQILVNSAGVLHRGGLDELDIDAWHATIAVNLTGTYLMMKACRPHLVAQHWGRVVNLTSIAGITRVGAGNVAYAASKAGVIGLTRDATRELGAHGVTVNAVAPGAVPTPMVAGNPAWDHAMRQATPIGRNAEPAEFAEIIAFLVSDAGFYLSGSVLVADGGMTSGIPIPELQNG